MPDLATAKSGQVLVRTPHDGIPSMLLSSVPIAEWLKPTPAQLNDRIRIDSLLKKRTGFGPHFFHDSVSNYNAADVLINVMRSTLRLLSFVILKARNCSV